MKEYSLVLNQVHMEPLLESLRLHQVSVENAPGSTEQEKAIMSDLLRRAELLHACATASNAAEEAIKAYDRYCDGLTTTREEAAKWWRENVGTDPYTGEDLTDPAPTVAPVKVMSRPL